MKSHCSLAILGVLAGISMFGCREREPAAAGKVPAASRSRDPSGPAPSRSRDPVGPAPVRVTSAENQAGKEAPEGVSPPQLPPDVQNSASWVNAQRILQVTRLFSLEGEVQELRSRNADPQAAKNDSAAEKGVK